MRPAANTWAAWRRAFLADLERRDPARLTLEGKRRWVVEFERFCRSQGVHQPCRLGGEHYLAWVRALAWWSGRRGWVYKPRTQATILGAVRYFLRWALTTGRLPPERADGLPPPRVAASRSLPPGPWGEWQAGFLQALRSRGQSAATLLIHTGWLARLERWSRTAGVDDPAALTRRHVTRFLQTLGAPQPHLGRPWALATQVQAQSTTRLFLRWAVKTGRLLVDPTSDTQLQQTPPSPRHIPTVEQMHALLMPRPGETRFQFRDRLMLELLYSTALRRGEAVGLDLTDVNLRDGWLRVRHGKGGTQRLVPVESHLAELLDRYLSEGRLAFQPPAHETALFLSAQGRRLGPQAVQRLVRNAGRRIGLVHLGAHDLRRACATHLVQAGAPLEAVSRQLGHRSLDAVRHYVRLSPQSLQAEHTRTHPRGR